MAVLPVAARGFSAATAGARGPPPAPAPGASALRAPAPERRGPWARAQWDLPGPRAQTCVSVPPWASREALGLAFLPQKNLFLMKEDCLASLCWPPPHRMDRRRLALAPPPRLPPTAHPSPLLWEVRVPESHRSLAGYYSVMVYVSLSSFLSLSAPVNGLLWGWWQQCWENSFTERRQETASPN